MKRFWHLMTHPEELSTPCAVFMEGNPMKYILGVMGIAYWLGHLAFYIWGSPPRNTGP